MNPKEKGNREERKQAKILSEWMFNDPDVLKRQSDSGALEIIWSGDIAPLKQMPLEWNSKWPFMIEIKSGYKEHYPDFWKYELLSKWVKKAYKESKTHNQNILFIVTQFYNRPSLVSINQCLTSLPFRVSFPIELDDKWKFIYVYKVKDLITLKFNEIFDISTLVK